MSCGLCWNPCGICWISCWRYSFHILSTLWAYRDSLVMHLFFPLSSGIAVYKEFADSFPPNILSTFLPNSGRKDRARIRKSSARIPQNSARFLQEFRVPLQEIRAFLRNPCDNYSFPCRHLPPLRIVEGCCSQNSPALHPPPAPRRPPAQFRAG